MAATLSPPPMIVMTLPFPAVVTSANIFAIAVVPCEKLDISKTPIGPFQTIVLACVFNNRSNVAIVSGPMSNPIHPSEIPSRSLGPIFAMAVLAVFSNASATTTSVGNNNCTFRSAANVMMRLAVSIISSSTNDLPIEYPRAL